MGKIFWLTLYGQPATKKNSATMVKNRATLLPSKPYRVYEHKCRIAIAKMTLKHFTMPVRLSCCYYLQDKAHWPDLTGLMQATADIISDTKEKRGKDGTVVRQEVRRIISDDRIIKSWNGTRIAGIDKHNPRVEIEIAELEVDMKTALDPYVEKQLMEEQRLVLF